MYSLEYSGMLYACILSSSVWLSLLTSYSILNYAKHSLYWGREETSSSPLPYNFPSPKAILFTFVLSALYEMRICYVLWEYVNMKGSRSTCARCVGGPGRPPPLPPRSVAGAVGGGGGELAGRVLPGILSREGGIFALWVRRVSFAGGYGKSIRQIYMANLYGNFIWRVCLAGQMGSFVQRLKARKHCKANEIERNGIYMVDL